ncbi:retinol-binding protein pinta-like [Microplitis mediator]|uniref:retinol-binding protein pinta-like n=1 Tax=Microplitis mediator TaxID=375433 RepID=UPI0025570045|nr:retinol-binding protein pinta-like [Microplitis mediator]
MLSSSQSTSDVQSPESEKSFASIDLSNEDDEMVFMKINEIRQWIHSNNKLCARTDDFTLLKFLRCCNYDVTKTQEKIYNYYAQRTKCPEWFYDRNPFSSELEELLDMGVFIPLIQFNDEGRMIIIIRVSIHDPYKHKIANVIKTGKMILDVAIKDNMTVSTIGVIVIFDMNNVTLSHGLQMTPRVVQRLVHSWQGCYPVKINSLNFINAPLHVNGILTIFKSFMSHKMRTKVNVYSKTSQNFFSNIPRHLLPAEYGGSAGNLKTLIDHWKIVVQKNKDWFIEEEKYRVIL